LTPRDTSTGNVLEQMVIPALRRGGYAYQKQVFVGKRPGGGKHYVDIVASKADGKPILVSMKWQQTSGTAEQKVPFEVICLLKALRNNEGRYEKAYVVLGGGGWTLRDFYIGGGLKEYLKDSDLVSVTTLESFVATANKGKL
jgi:PD-(D/E)XK nuclease superfamily domain